MAKNPLPLVIPLSKAEREQLIALYQSFKIQEARLQEFVGFLRQQHDCSEKDYNLSDVNIGFQRKPSRTS